MTNQHFSNQHFTRPQSANQQISILPVPIPLPSSSKLKSILFGKLSISENPIKSCAKVSYPAPAAGSLLSAGQTKRIFELFCWHNTHINQSIFSAGDSLVVVHPLLITTQRFAIRLNIDRCLLIFNT